VVWCGGAVRLYRRKANSRVGGAWYDPWEVGGGFVYVEGGEGFDIDDSVLRMLQEPREHSRSRTSSAPSLSRPPHPF